MTGAFVQFAALAPDVERGHPRSTCQSPRTVVPARGNRPELLYAPSGSDNRPPALSRGPCPRCETRGDLGCRHQRPYEASPLDPAPQLDAESRRQRERFGQPLTPAEEEQLIALRAGGLTYREIGRAIGRSNGSIDSAAARLRKSGRIP